MQKTGIPWTEYTWNPTCGCDAKCDYCYARKVHNMRHKAYKAGKKLPPQYAKPFEEIQLFPDRLEQPLHKRKSCMIFVDSVGDLFDPSVPFEFINKVFDVIWQTNHTYQILTKRPKRIEEYLRWCKGQVRFHSKTEGRPKVWTGVTVEHPDYKHRIDILRQIPAAVRFLSIEPCLADMELSESPTNVYCEACTGPYDCNWEGQSSELLPLPAKLEDTEYAGLCPKCKSEASFGPSSSKALLDDIDWVIVGCESGPKRRECKTEWVRDIVDQCKAAGVPVFIKQLSINGQVSKDIAEWPEDLRVQEYPKEGL